MNEEKSELDPKQVFNFVGYQFDLREGKVRPTPERWQTLTDKILSILSSPVCPVRQFMSLIGLLTATEKQVHLGRFHMRPIVALEKQLEGTRITRQGDTRSQVAPPSLKVVAGGKQCSSRSTITPTKRCSAHIYRCIKRRVGHSLKRTHCKGNLVSSRKQVAHESLGAKGGLSGLKRVPRPLFKQHSPGSHRQHNSGCLYQQRRGDEVGLPVCPIVENPVLVHQEAGNSQGTSHPRPAERDSRIAIQARPSRRNGPFNQKCSKLYAPGGTSHRWTCLLPGSTTNCHSLYHRFRTPRHGQWMHSARHGKIWTHTPFHQQPSWAKW